MLFFRMFQHLLPRARAWNITLQKQLREFFEGLANALAATKTFIDDLFEDLDPQQTTQLDLWEAQFGLEAGSLTEQERRDRLEEKWKEYGNLSADYLQNVLQNAGFNVYVHNSFSGSATTVPPTIRDPRDYLADANNQKSATDCGDTDTECGEPVMECGEFTTSLLIGRMLVNKKSLTTDNVGPQPPVPSNPDEWPYFVYIGDQTFPDIADINEGDREAFETLVLQYRPMHLRIGLLIDYI